MENNERDEFFDSPTPEPRPTSPAPSPAPQKKGGKGLRIACIVLGAALIFVAAFLGGWYGQYNTLDEEVRSYLWAKSVLEDNYYQPIEEGELYQNMFDSLSIDPYTRFYSSQDYSNYLSESAGEMRGTGIYFFVGQNQNDTAHIFSVAENSPASFAGIEAGMYILAFGESETSLTSGVYADYRAFAAGREGEFVVRCGYQKDGSDARNFTVEREEYQTSYLYYRDSGAGFRFSGEGSVLSLTETAEPLAGLDEKTAYLRFDEFSGNNTPSEFIQVLKKMKERGRTNLILDLRSNGGGNVAILGSVASHFMKNSTESRPTVMISKSRSGQKTSFVCSKSDYSDYFTENSRITVLADEYTASASECLLGVLIDYGACSYSDIYLREDENGTAKTYGKGIMQTQFKGPNGEAMKLTTATVHWPISERCIHGVGVTVADGANPVPSPFFRTAEDPMLKAVLAKVCG